MSRATGQLQGILFGSSYCHVLREGSCSVKVEAGGMGGEVPQQRRRVLGARDPPMLGVSSASLPPLLLPDSEV